jgi:hypothetical protein
MTGTSAFVSLKIEEEKFPVDSFLGGKERGGSE